MSMLCLEFIYIIVIIKIILLQYNYFKWNHIENNLK